MAGANLAEWRITPIAAGALIIHVSLLEGEMVVDAGVVAGWGTYTLANAATRQSARFGIGLGLGL